MGFDTNCPMCGFQIRFETPSEDALTSRLAESEAKLTKAADKTAAAIENQCTPDTCQWVGRVRELGAALEKNAVDAIANETVRNASMDVLMDMQRERDTALARVRELEAELDRLLREFPPKEAWADNSASLYSRNDIAAAREKAVRGFADKATPMLCCLDTQVLARFRTVLEEYLVQLAEKEKKG